MNPKGVPRVMRYIPLVVAVGCVICGIVAFPPGNLRSPRYVTEPRRLWWSLPRLLDTAQWTSEGLTYRRRFLAWLVISVVATVATVLIWS